MENKQYYTPDISELFIGYECELKGWEDDITWYPTVLEQRMLSTIKVDETRTPYLTKGQIESDGWNFISNDLGFPEYYRKGSFHIIPREKGIYEIIKVDFKNTEEFSKSKPTYIGNIKSINELRKIQKWLGII